MRSKSKLRAALLAWYRENRRALPWRQRISPYRTWVSEIMLQQTTVRTAIPYYERFLKAFPDIRSLARAPLAKVLRYWAGLGYYSRARNLHAAARKIMTEHGGRFPSSFDEILALPGVGRYTAGAILSIAFAQPYPIVDGNIMRVFSRLFGIKQDITKPATQREMWARAETLMPPKECGDWNQALMELGATVCVPEGPNCGACPLRRFCRARQLGLEDELPVSAAGKAPVDLDWTLLWVEKDGKVLLWKRSEQERFLPGHWGLPEARHLRAKPGRVLKVSRHSITHHRITARTRTAEANGNIPASARWVARGRLKNYLVSSLFAKALPVCPPAAQPDAQSTTAGTESPAKPSSRRIPATHSSRTSPRANIAPSRGDQETLVARPTSRLPS